MKNNYYVYTHEDMEGNIFYIGRGVGNRAWSKKRNKFWNEKVNQIGDYEIKIAYDKLTKEEAIDCEGLLIQLYGIDNLTNIKNELPKSNSTLYYDILQKAKDLQILFDILENFDYYWKHKPTRDKLKFLIGIQELHLQVKKQLQLLNI